MGKEKYVKIDGKEYRYSDSFKSEVDGKMFYAIETLFLEDTYKDELENVQVFLEGMEKVKVLFVPCDVYAEIMGKTSIDDSGWIESTCTHPIPFIFTYAYFKI